jgi:hypothetical protein
MTENQHRPPSIIKELWLYLKLRKKYWLFPVIIVMVVLGGLIILAPASPASPFIYTLF